MPHIGLITINLSITLAINPIWCDLLENYWGIDILCRRLSEDPVYKTWDHLSKIVLIKLNTNKNKLQKFISNIIPYSTLINFSEAVLEFN